LNLKGATSNSKPKKEIKRNIRDMDENLQARIEVLSAKFNSPPTTTTTPPIAKKQRTYNRVTPTIRQMEIMNKP
jgi:hypothetical protein